MRKFLLAAALAALPVAMSGCASGSTPAPAATPAPTGGAALAGGEWAVTEINGTPIVADSKPTIEFKDGKVFGAGSCNRFMGGYTVSPDGLKLQMSQMASTMMACADPQMQQEGVFLKTLADVTGYSVSGNVLTLTTSGGQTIKAKR